MYVTFVVMVSLVLWVSRFKVSLVSWVSWFLFVCFTGFVGVMTNHEVMSSVHAFPSISDTTI